jgi:hypothetical protein
VTLVLYSSTLEIPTAANGAALDCNVVNVGDQPAFGELQIFAGDGSSLAYGGYNDLAPGGATGISVSAFQNPAQVEIAYCRVTLENDDESQIRASLLLRDPAGNTLATAEAT